MGLCEKPSLCPIKTNLKKEVSGPQGTICAASRSLLQCLGVRVDAEWCHPSLVVVPYTGKSKLAGLYLVHGSDSPSTYFNTIAQAFLSHSHFMALKSFLLSFFSPLTLFHGHVKTRLACSFRWHMYRARLIVGVSYWDWPVVPSGPSGAACGPTITAPSFVPGALLASCSVSAPGRRLPCRTSGLPVRVPAAGPSEGVICCDVEC